MYAKESIFQELSEEECQKLKGLAVVHEYKAGEMVFSEGEEAEHIYFIDSGMVSILIQKFHDEEEISRLGPGDYFGEMAIFSKEKRAASVRALEDTVLHCVGEECFLDLIEKDKRMAEKIDYILARRNEELVMKESLLGSTGLNSENLHVSIKGDPSMRESTFTRERYHSVVDDLMPLLQKNLGEMLLKRSVYQVYIGFNNGEIRTSSIFDPYNEEIHPAKKLADISYINRHFPAIEFDEKAWLIRRTYQSLCQDRVMERVPHHFRRRYEDHYEAWEPIQPTEVKNTLARLPDLRSIENLYLRNFTINVTRGCIRMQFNCDGTHIISTRDYDQFLEDYVV